MKIKLDNLDRDDGSVMITTEDREEAILDQSIHGARWEAPGDLSVAYAIVDDRPFLLTALLAEGYDVDDSEYVEPTRPRSAS